MLWEDVTNALIAAFVAATRLEPTRVLWAHQDTNAPDEAFDYVTLSLGPMIPVGQDFVHTSTDLNRPRNQEVRIEVLGTRETALEVQYFTQSGQSGRSSAALAKLTAATAALTLPSVRTILQNADIGAFDVGRVDWVPDIPNLRWRGRARCTVRLYLPLPTVEEYVGFIERVTGTVTTTDNADGEQTYPFDTAAATERGDEE